MQVFVNDRAVAVQAGMTVRHALIAAGLLKKLSEGKRVFDAWGNEVGLDGALSSNSRLYVR
jgi:hypothetical protein